MVGSILWREWIEWNNISKNLIYPDAVHKRFDGISEKEVHKFAVREFTVARNKIKCKLNRKNRAIKGNKFPKKASTEDSSEDSDSIEDIENIEEEIENIEEEIEDFVKRDDEFEGEKNGANEEDEDGTGDNF